MLFLNRNEEEEMAQKRLSMRKIEETLRLKYEKKLTHRAIAQACSVSSSTVSEYITHAKAAGLRWPLPEGLDAEELEEMLFPKRAPVAGRSIPQPDWGEVHRELRRKSVTLSLLWVEYRQAHPDGYGYSQFCQNYNKWAKQLKPMMRQRHRAGEKLFIDYAGQTAPVVDAQTGEVRDVEIFVAVLGASNYTYAEAHESQTLANWLGAHVRALSFLGVPEVLVPDNLKAGVKSPDRYEPDLNPSYQEFARHYDVAVVPARVRKPKDKAKVESGVQVVERWILARLRDHTFFSLAELNRAIRELLEELNSRPMRHLGQSRRELFESLDKPELAPLPAQPYEFAHWKKARVHIDYHVEFDKHFYSVPWTLIGKEVDVRGTEKAVEVFHNRARQASHPRSHVPGRYSTQREHMPPAHQQVSDWSPERFLRWAEEMGPHTKQLIAAVLESRRHPQQAYRSCLGILGLGKRYTNARLEAACRRALPAGIRSYKGIRNILENKLDQVEREPPPATPLSAHANIRGEGYYN
jgi:transposase